MKKRKKLKKLLTTSVLIMSALVLSACGDGGGSASSIPAPQKDYQTKYSDMHNKRAKSQLGTRERDVVVADYDVFLQSLEGMPVDGWVCTYNGLAKDSWDPKITKPMDIKIPTSKGEVEFQQVLVVECTEPASLKTIEKGKTYSPGFTLLIPTSEIDNLEKLYDGDKIAVTGMIVSGEVNGWDSSYSGINIQNAKYKTLKKAN